MKGLDEFFEILRLASRQAHSVDEMIKMHRPSPHADKIKASYDEYSAKFPLKNYKVEVYTPTNMPPNMAGVFAAPLGEMCPVHKVVHQPIICLNYWYVDLWPQWVIGQGMAHEYSHAMEWDMYGPYEGRTKELQDMRELFGDHGPIWQQNMRTLGYPNAKASHNFPVGAVIARMEIEDGTDNSVRAIG